MLDRVSVLIPYQSDHNGPRDSALEWVLGFYARALPEAEVVGDSLQPDPSFIQRNIAAVAATTKRVAIGGSRLRLPRNRQPRL